MAREIDKNCVEGNCFAINDKSHGVGDNKLNIVYKANYTGQICTAKFRITSKDGNIVKEYMIAQDAKPVYYNIKMVQPFTKDDCLANQHGSEVLYTVEERTYKSFISQEDADAKAMEDIALNGQKYANEHGECITDIWYNEEQRKTFIRNNCDKFSDGQEYVYIIPEGKYVSSISQEDADRKALEDIEKNGQQQANLEGECKPKENIYYGKFSKTFTRNNCDSTQYGTDVVVDETMVTGDFRSIVSQEDANSLARAAVEAQGQDIANIKGNCEKIPVFTGSYSKVFQRTNCPEGSTPVDFTVDEKMCSGYPFTSTVSQDAANKLAQDAVEAQGQAITNERGDCQTNVYYNVRMEKTVTRNNCDEFHIGQPYTYVVSAGKYFSIISQKDADDKAKADLEANAQQQANLEGECKEKTIYYGKYSKEFTRNNCDKTQYGTKVTVDETMVTGDFRSTVSQEDANNKAKAAVNSQGQAVANSKGTCTWIGSYTGQVQKNNCADGGVGDMVSVSSSKLPGHPYTSTVSLADANKKAENAVRGSDGQAYANKNGGCTWTYVASRDFYRNNCAGSGVGQRITVTSTQANGGTPITSKVSLADARSKAEQILDQRGQDYANQHGTCVWTGTGSYTFYKDNCGSCKQGVAISVPYSSLGLNPITSTVSQADANNKVQDSFRNDSATRTAAQAYANKDGDCEDTPPDWTSWSYDGGRRCSSGDVWATYRRSDRNGCHADQTEDRVYEYCSCGCSGGSCDSCCDPNSWSRVGDAECRSGVSVALYRNDCGDEEYRSYGSACCNTLGFQGGSVTSRNCPSDKPCGVRITYPDVPSGSICASSTSSANAQARDKIDRLRSLTQALADAGCSAKVGNDDRWGNVKATNCPSNCTPKTISYKQIAGKYTACTKDEANRIADNNLQSDGISYANGLAQADRCDCV